MNDTPSPQEVIVTLSLRFKPGQRDAVLARLAPAVALTRAEPGNRLFDVFATRDEPDRLVLLERWENQAALDWHLEQSYLRDVLTLFAETLAEPIVEGGNVHYLTDALPVSGIGPA